MKHKIFLTLLTVSFIFGCRKSADPLVDNKLDNAGWTGTDNADSVPTTVGFGFGSGSASSLPSAYDLTKFLPPIGNQGQYGTCVGWATAYNLKSSLVAVDFNLSASQLTSPNNQFSPKDLYLSIPDNKKGIVKDKSGNIVYERKFCGGTDFTEALNVMQNRGVSKMSDVPYDGLGDCSTSRLSSSGSSLSSSHKIEYWRRIEGTISAIKENIANNIPVLFGAKLSDNFMRWNTDAVFSANTTYDLTGLHSYHAMVIVGYDDNKGANGAFKIVNSWGTTFGSNGFIWVDYNFFINQFCTNYDSGSKPLFIAKSKEANQPSPDVDPVNPNTNGIDFASWVFSDISVGYNSTANRWARRIEFNIYNIGTQTVSNNLNWNITLLLVNAYNANDYSIIFNDQFNTNALYTPLYNGLGVSLPISIEAGKSFAYYMNQLGQTPMPDRVGRTYYMPFVTGSYYLVLLADSYNVIRENNEQDNLFYTTTYPKFFNNGFSNRMSASGSNDFKFTNDLECNLENLKNNKYNDASNFKPNAYTNKEIRHVLERDKQNGIFEKRLKEYNQLNNGGGQYQLK